MTVLRNKQDAFGYALLDAYRGNSSPVVFERRDGYIDIGSDVKHYFSLYDDWLPQEKKVSAFAKGKILDIGCGAGRCVMHFQNLGFEVVGIDNSSLAIRVCKKMGARKVKAASLSSINSSLGTFDTILMLGGNFGLLGSREAAVRYLRRFHRLTSEQGLVLAGAANPYKTNDADYRRLHRLNRRNGLMPGQTQVRIRYKSYATPYFNWLTVSPSEMAGLAAEAGWRLERLIETSQSSYFCAVIGKYSASPTVRRS